MNVKYGTDLKSPHTPVRLRNAGLEKVQPAWIEGVSKEFQTNLNIEFISQVLTETVLSLYY